MTKNELKIQRIDNLYLFFRPHRFSKPVGSWY